MGTLLSSLGFVVISLLPVLVDSPLVVAQRPATGMYIRTERSGIKCAYLDLAADRTWFLQEGREGRGGRNPHCQLGQGASGTYTVSAGYLTLTLAGGRAERLRVAGDTLLSASGTEGWVRMTPTQLMQYLLGELTYHLCFYSDRGPPWARSLEELRFTQRFGAIVELHVSSDASSYYAVARHPQARTVYGVFDGARPNMSGVQWESRGCF